MSLSSQENKLRYRNVAIMIVLGVVFGSAYNALYYPHTLTEYLEAVSISIFIGGSLGFAEEFLFKRFFHTIAFYKVLFIRTTLYSLFTCAVLSLVLSIEIAYDEELSYFNALIFYFRSPMFTRDYFFTIAFIFIMIFAVQVIQIVGLNNMIRLMLGRYHKPREVKRIFMFIDLNDSTSIAEQLGNERYSAFLREYFFDVSDAINIYHGEIYQYVGDEVTVVWPLRGKGSDPINCFFKIQEIISEKKERYLKKYNLIPEFKAGIHAGKVLITEVGKMKKELVYHGDVVNTTSRIMGNCKELHQQLLISEDLLSRVGNTAFDWQEQGELLLKGKTQKIKLYGVEKSDL